MKLYTDLFEKTISVENLLAAWDEFKNGKRTKPDVQTFEYRLGDNIFKLREELAGKTYRHSPYYAFYVRDPKVRLIHKAEVRDRIVHHAVYQSLNPIFESTFIFDSYSCRKGKGTHKAVRRFKVFLEKTWQGKRKCFVLKCDIRKFFQSIDHGILLGIIMRRVKDPEMLWLIQTLVSSFIAAPARERERERAAALSAT